MVSGIPVWTQALTLILHFGWCHLFIIKLEWREVGAAIATNITYILNMVITDLWIRCGANSKYKHMIFFYDRTCFTDLWAYIKIGTMGMFMLCFEWWAFELLAIFSGLLGVTALASEVVVINMVTFIFMLPLGISYSASALVGNYLGEGNIRDAKIYASLTIVLNVILTSIIVIIIGFNKRSLAALFTQREDI
jgi:MATE family multidrug resistance protein